MSRLVSGSILNKFAPCHLQWCISTTVCIDLCCMIVIIECSVLKKARVDLDAVRTYKGLRLLHVNIRSLVPKWEEVCATFFKCDLDVLIFTETWLHANIQDTLISHPEYNLIDLLPCLMVKP